MATENQLVKIIESQGFAIVFGILVMIFLYRNGPKFLDVWTKFIVAINDNTSKMATMNNEMVIMSNEIAKSQERTTNVLEKLKELNSQLDKHTADAYEIKSNQEKILETLELIKNKIINS